MWHQCCLWTREGGKPTPWECCDILKYILAPQSFFFFLGKTPDVKQDFNETFTGLDSNVLPCQVPCHSSHHQFTHNMQNHVMASNIYFFVSIFDSKYSFCIWKPPQYPCPVFSSWHILQLTIGHMTEPTWLFFLLSSNWIPHPPPVRQVKFGHLAFYWW